MAQLLFLTEKVSEAGWDFLCSLPGIFINTF